MSHIIKLYNDFQEWMPAFSGFLDDIAKTLENQTVLLWLHYVGGEIFYSLNCGKITYPTFESQFYTHFNDFQIIEDDKNLVWNYDKSKTVIGEVGLDNDRFFPFSVNEGNDSDFMFNMFRTFENFDVINDKVSFFVSLKSIKEWWMWFNIKTSLDFKLFKTALKFKIFKYLFNHKVTKNWKQDGEKYFNHKLMTELFETQMFFVVQSDSKLSSQAKIKSIFNNFLVFENFPSNQFKIKYHKDTNTLSQLKARFSSPNHHKYLLNQKEIASFFHFPKNPKTETALLTVKSKKLALPVGIPTYNYTINEQKEVMAKDFPQEANIIGISDYRSIRVPIGIYDEDRLKHMYIVGKTWSGKSKLQLSLMINDIKQWKGIWVIDPHGDAIEEIMSHIPEYRKEDVIIFDPTDDKFPFCLNPLDVGETESKQVLAKWFIDIFKKFFGANWNPKLEHVLRMIFLALLDKKDSTLFDIIRALTDKDFRYEMIDQIQDDVVRNFRTNEFAGWSQQFNTEAIMPILNKVGQILSIEILKNIFASPQNKLDFRKVMDESKILLIKLPKGKLQEEIMGFLGAMFVTKLYQAAMGRQSVEKHLRTPFFLYVDEFQNFATETFNEILSEARKYWLSLTVAHQFIKQIPSQISDALFGNVGTLVSFRISSEDSETMKHHFAPFLSGYDIANLNMREFYCKLLVRGQVKDPFSLKSVYMPDIKVNREFIAELYDISRKKYSRSLEEAKKAVETKQKDVMKTIEEFSEPII